MDEATEPSFREPIILRIPKARYVRNNTRNRSPSFSPTNPRASSTMRSESSIQDRRPVSRLHQQGSKPPKKIAKMSTTSSANRTGSSSTSHSKRNKSKQDTSASVSICRSNQSSRASSKRNKSKQDTSASVSISRSNQSSRNSMKEFCAFCADEVTPLDIKSKNGIVECSGHKVHKYCKPDCVKAHY